MNLTEGVNHFNRPSSEIGHFYNEIGLEEAFEVNLPCRTANLKYPPLAKFHRLTYLLELVVLVKQLAEPVEDALREVGVEHVAVLPLHLGLPLEVIGHVGTVDVPDGSESIAIQPNSGLPGWPLRGQILQIWPFFLFLASKFLRMFFIFL